MWLDKGWFTEICDDGGSAFSLKVKEKLHQEQTPYQLIEIYATENFGNLMVIDGFIMLSGLDNFIYHEMMSHPVLYSHAAPKDVVIIGGGDCGTLQQVLLHQELRSVIQIDIDRRVTELAEIYFPELCTSNGDPRATLAFEDGIDWMQNAAAGSVDIIIVDSTDPVGPAEGLFGETFYQNCHRALRGDGLLIQQSESPLIHQKLLKEMIQAMLAAGFVATDTLHFPLSVYPSGWWSATMASKTASKTASETAAPAFLRAEQASQKEFETRYYSADVHRAALVQMPFLKGITY